MATCLICLARLNISTSPKFQYQIAAFSTSALRALPQPGRPDSSSRGQKTSFRKGKRKIEARGRVPSPGERKAVRKRIVLSNTNALEVDGLVDWGAVVSDSAVGTMVVIPDRLVDALRSIEAFKSGQGWGFFRRPATLIRKETMELTRHIYEHEASSGENTMRRIIIGDRGSGKSVLLLQAQSAAFEAGWVVMHFPEAQDLTSAATEYSPVDSTSSPKYAQKTYTAALLARIATANAKILSSLQISSQHQLPIPVQSNMSLDRFAMLGAQDPEIAWPVFVALWKELMTPGRPPVLLTADGIAHISRTSHYLAPDMFNIHAFDLALVDHFVSHLTGARKLHNGGMILGADSASNRPANPTLDLLLRQTDQVGEESAKLPLFDTDKPYDKHDLRVLETLRGVKIMRVPGLTRDEAKAVLEYYAKSGMFKEAVTDRLVSEKWTLSGGGIIGELERSSVRAYA